AVNIFLIGFEAVDPFDPGASMRLYAPDGQDGDRFGWDVHHTIANTVVGAPSAGSAGAVYAFDHDYYNGPTLVLKFVPDDLGEDDECGTSVAIFGSIVIGGAPYHDGSSPNSGAAYVTEYGLPAFRFNATSGQHLEEIEFGQFTPVDISGTV